MAETPSSEPAPATTPISLHEHLRRQVLRGRQLGSMKNGPGIAFGTARLVDTRATPHRPVSAARTLAVPADPAPSVAASTLSEALCTYPVQDVPAAVALSRQRDRQQPTSPVAACPTPQHGTSKAGSSRGDCPKLSFIPRREASAGGNDVGPSLPAHAEQQGGCTDTRAPADAIGPATAAAEGVSHATPLAAAPPLQQARRMQTRRVAASTTAAGAAIEAVAVSAPHAPVAAAAEADVKAAGVRECRHNRSAETGSVSRKRRRGDVGRDAATAGGSLAEDSAAGACNPAADRRRRRRQSLEVGEPPVVGAGCSGGNHCGDGRQGSVVSHETEPGSSAPQQQRQQQQQQYQRQKKNHEVEEPAVDPRGSTWVPPASPWGLIEEALYDDPWRLLVACILLNRTTGRQVRRVLGPLWRAFPTAESMAGADPRVLEPILRPLGLQQRRSVKLVRFSFEFTSKQWTCPTELFGVGQYGADAYLIFFRGCWREVRPSDKDLRRYRDWLESTGGQGSGLEREDIASVLAAGEAADGGGGRAAGGIDGRGRGRGRRRRAG